MPWIWSERIEGVLLCFFTLSFPSDKLMSARHLHDRVQKSQRGHVFFLCFCYSEGVVVKRGAVSHIRLNVVQWKGCTERVVKNTDSMVGGHLEATNGWYAPFSFWRLKDVAFSNQGTCSLSNNEAASYPGEHIIWDSPSAGSRTYTFSWSPERGDRLFKAVCLGEVLWTQKHISRKGFCLGGLSPFLLFSIMWQTPLTGCLVTTFRWLICQVLFTRSLRAAGLFGKYLFRNAVQRSPAELK